MTSPSPIIAIIGSVTQDAYIAQVARVLADLVGAGMRLVIEPRFAAYLGEHFDIVGRGCLVGDITIIGGELPQLTVSFGGDGTFLRAAAWVADAPVPILGVNTGHLGYLAAVKIDDAMAMIHSALHGDCQMENRSLIEVVSQDVSQAGLWPYALNEVAVIKEDTASMITVDARLGDVPLASYHADGLLVATPTGSTAYNLSVGGPIIEPVAPNWVVTPIAAHTLTMRPLVLSDSSELRLTTRSRADVYRISIDGRSLMLPSGSEVVLRRAPFTIGVVQPRDHSFAQTLRNKLLWGN